LERAVNMIAGDIDTNIVNKIARMRGQVSIIANAVTELSVQMAELANNLQLLVMEVNRLREEAREIDKLRKENEELKKKLEVKPDGRGSRGRRKD